MTTQMEYMAETSLLKGGSMIPVEARGDRRHLTGTILGFGRKVFGPWLKVCHDTFRAH